MNRRSAILISSVTATLFIVLFCWPLLRVIGGGFLTEDGFTLEFLAGVFRNPVYAEGLRNSLGIAIGTTTLTFLLALPPAWLATRFEFPAKRLLSAMLLLLSFLLLLPQYQPVDRDDNRPI